MEHMQIQRYPAYKDSGVEWLGKIPEHWKTLANKYIFRLRKTQVGKKSYEYTLLSLTLKGIIKRDMENPEGKFPAEFDTYQEVKRGDFVFCLFDVEETPRTVGLSQYEGMITGAYTVMEADSSFDKDFLYYFYLNLDEKKRLKPLYKGLRNTIPKERFFSFKTFIPLLSEQTRIANVLDRKTAQIDAAIAQKERLIALLHERRELAIEYALEHPRQTTLYDGRSLPWLYELSSGWSRKPLKTICSMKGRLGWQNLRSDEYVEEGPLLVSSEHFKGDKVEWNRCNHVTRERFQMAPEIILKPDDVLFMKDGASMGKLAHIDSLPQEAC